MYDVLTVIAVIAGFASVIALGAWLGAGSHDSLAGLFAGPTMLGRSMGVQEHDLPRFAI